MQATFESGALVRIQDYEFEDGSTRDKYLIVLLLNQEKAYIIHTLTTSRNNVGVSQTQRGCSVHEGKFPYYFFPAGVAIDESGYYFDKDTFIFFKNNVHKVDLAAFAKYDVPPFGLLRLATLSTSELKRLLKCILKSKFIPLNLKQELNDFKDQL